MNVTCISNLPTPRLADQSRAQLEACCQTWCQRFGLAQVYLVYALGRRRHFLAGYGQPVVARPQQIALGGQYFLCWYGLLSESEQVILAQEARGMLAVSFNDDGKVPLDIACG